MNMNSGKVLVSLNTNFILALIDFLSGLYSHFFSGESFLYTFRLQCNIGKRYSRWLYIFVWPFLSTSINFAPIGLEKKKTGHSQPQNVFFLKQTPLLTCGLSEEGGLQIETHVGKKSPTSLLPVEFFLGGLCPEVT